MSVSTYPGATVATALAAPVRLTARVSRQASCHWRPAVVHRHPVAQLRERLRHRPADAPGRPRHQYRSLHRLSSHRDSNLVAVAQFLAVAASGCFFCFTGALMIRNSAWASSLVP